MIVELPQRVPVGLWLSQSDIVGQSAVESRERDGKREYIVTEPVRTFSIVHQVRGMIESFFALSTFVLFSALELLFEAMPAPTGKVLTA